MVKNLFIFAAILLLVAALAYFAFSNLNPVPGGKTAEINGKVVKLEIADSPEEQIKGLSNRDNLADDGGMLFIFEKPDLHAFWMKDVRFPLDIIFLQKDKVITIHKNVRPQLGEENTANLKLYQPTEAADRVLELRGGQADALGLKEGDTVKINL